MWSSNPLHLVQTEPSQLCAYCLKMSFLISSVVSVSFPVCPMHIKILLNNRTAGLSFKANFLTQPHSKQFICVLQKKIIDIVFSYSQFSWKQCILWHKPWPSNMAKWRGQIKFLGAANSAIKTNELRFTQPTVLENINTPAYDSGPLNPFPLIPATVKLSTDDNSGDMNLLTSARLSANPLPPPSDQCANAGGQHTSLSQNVYWTRSPFSVKSQNIYDSVICHVSSMLWYRMKWTLKLVMGHFTWVIQPNVPSDFRHKQYV